jgi:uncharacterized delta-60 repeat protein
MQEKRNASLQDLFKPKNTPLTALVVLLASTLIYGQTQSGTLDLSFGTDGKVTTDFAGSGDEATAVAVQADRKLIVAGQATINSGSDFAVARYDSNGTLDPSFGTGGKVTTDFGSPYEVATSVAVQPDGKIVVAGGSVIGDLSDFALARYDTDGTLDTGFGAGGKVLTDFGVSAQAYSVAVEPDGRIVVAGEANIDGNNDFELVRYNSDGTLDTTFGSGGKVSTEFGLLEQGFSYALGYSLALQPDGKIVVSGEAFMGDGSDFALARYNNDGTLDASFGTGGKVTTNVGGRRDAAFSVAIQPDGTIIVAGLANIGRGSGFALARYESDGALDTTFGSGGEVTTDFGLLDQGFSVAHASSLAVQPDGKIVAGGGAFLNGGFHSALAQYNSNGSLDTGFGIGGRVTTIFGGSADKVSSIVVQPDGRIVAAGRAATVIDNGDFALARFN